MHTTVPRPQKTMKSDDANDDVMPKSSYPLAPRALEPSRTFAYVSMGALTSALPLPWVPDVVTRRVRGTLLHDIATQHGLALTEEARQILSEVWFSGLPKLGALPAVLAQQAGKFALGRALAFLGPLGWLPPVRNALYTYILGHVFSRYLETARRSRAIRIDAEEAKLVRKALERAMVATLTVESRSPWKDTVAPPEELRNGATQLVDGVLLSIACLPSWLVERLDTAFDEAWSRVRATT